MKINLKYFIVLSIFCTFASAGYSQKGNNTLLKDTHIADVKLKLENDDSRPPFILKDVKDATFINVKAPPYRGGLKNLQELKVPQLGDLGGRYLGDLGGSENMGDLGVKNLFK